MITKSSFHAKILCCWSISIWSVPSIALLHIWIKVFCHTCLAKFFRNCFFLYKNHANNGLFFFLVKNMQIKKYRTDSSATSLMVIQFLNKICACVICCIPFLNINEWIDWMMFRWFFNAFIYKLNIILFLCVIIILNIIVFQTKHLNIKTYATKLCVIAHAWLLFVIFLCQSISFHPINYEFVR